MMQLESALWDAQSIKDIENNHQVMVHAYYEEIIFKDIVNKCSDLKT